MTNVSHNFYKITEKGVELKIRAFPNSNSNKIDTKLYIDADNQQYLKVYIASVAEGGKANKSIIEIVSKAIKIPKSHINITSGTKSRCKTLLIDKDFKDIVASCLPKSLILEF